MVTMGGVWDRTIEFLGDRLSLILPVAILAILVPSTVSGSLAGLELTAAPIVRAGLVLASVAFAILSLWGQLAITALAIDPAVGAQASRMATRRLLAAIGVYAVGGIVATVLIGVQVVLLATAGGIDLGQLAIGGMPRMTMAPGRALGLSLAVLAEFILLLFAIARLSPLTAVIVAERRGIGAYARAFRLTRGLTWRLMGVIVLYAIVTGVSVYAAQTVFGSILRLVTSSEGTVSVAGVLTAVIVAAVNTAFTVLAAAFCAKLYVATVARADTNVAGASV